MAIIDDAYFEGIIRLDTSKATTKERLEDYINYTEEFYIRKLLGDLYYDYSATEKPTWYASFIAKSTFEYGDKKYTNDIKQMIAYFAYYEFSQDQTSFNSPVGEQKSNVSTSTSVIPSSKLMRAYNLGVDLYNNAVKYCLENNFDCESEEIEKINTFGI